jgi:periplasmic divalent cation tolerance protein
MIMLMIGWTTIGTAAAANVLARSMIEKQLAICVQIDGPITSLYRWEDEIQSETEFRLMVKFLSDQAGPLETHILTAHPYENPEWISAEVTHVTEKYLSWAKANSNLISL